MGSMDHSYGFSASYHVLIVLYLDVMVKDFLLNYYKKVRGSHTARNFD